MNEPNINTDNLLAAFQFGPFGFDTRTVYMIGTASAGLIRWIASGQYFKRQPTGRYR
jgi:hypothetical protein